MMFSGVESADVPFCGTYAHAFSPPGFLALSVLRRSHRAPDGTAAQEQAELRVRVRQRASDQMRLRSDRLGHRLGPFSAGHDEGRLFSRSGAEGRFSRSVKQVLASWCNRTLEVQDYF